MSAVRARYSGSSGTGVDLTVELDTGEFRNVHVKQGGLLPEDVNGSPISAAFRDSLLAQDDWTRFRQSAQSSSTKTDAPAADDKKES
jgi:hypothetical protein